MNAKECYLICLHYFDDYLTTGFVNFHANYCLGFAGGSTVNYIHQLGVIVLPIGYQINCCNLQPNTCRWEVKRHLAEKGIVLLSMYKLPDSQRIKERKH